MPPDDAIAAALSEIHLEFAGSLNFPNANREQVREGIIALSKAELDQGVFWAHDRGELIRHMTSWAPLGSDSERTTIHNAVLDEKRKTMTKDANKATRSAAVTKRITEAFNSLQEAQLEYGSFSRLRTNEAAVAPRWVGRLERCEKMLQSRPRCREKGGSGLLSVPNCRYPHTCPCPPLNHPAETVQSIWPASLSKRPLALLPLALSRFAHCASCGTPPGAVPLPPQTVWPPLPAGTWSGCSNLFPGMGSMDAS